MYANWVINIFYGSENGLSDKILLKTFISIQLR